MIKFLDFDGVVVDSIEECYLISKSTYFGYASFAHKENDYKKIFYKYRGLVRPAYEYLILHKAIEIFIEDRSQDFEKLFKLININTIEKDKNSFEKEFFYKRSLYQEENLEAWAGLNPLTPFGETLINSNNADVYIVTTKNKAATIALLDYYKIKVSGVYANDEIKSFGSKGKLISALIQEKNYRQAIFLDDAVEHLDTVKDDKVKCFFADWGYGKNTTYEVYEY